MTNPDNATTTLDTRLQHLGVAPFDPLTQSAPVALPPIRTSTVRFANMQALDQAIQGKTRGERVVTYGRVGMQTHAALEQVFCALEGAQRCFLAPSGMAAITLALLALLDSGDHVLVADCAYDPVRSLDDKVLSRLGIQVSYARAEPTVLQQYLRTNTRVLYVESPGSGLFEMLDMPALAVFAQAHDLILVTDNTWGSGLIYQPLALGADVSVIAGTKYVGGHSDLMLGAVVANRPALIEKLSDTHYAMGTAISADDAWLALRGVHTLPIRMRAHAQHALEVCQFLASRAEVAQIFHPAWPGDSGHALWQRDCSGSNGMLALALRFDQTQVRRFIDNLTLFSIGASWGGYESLVRLMAPAMMKLHAYWQGGDLPVVRLHIGLESPQDLIADIAQALDAARK